jgi:hypothetical protein
MRKEYKAKFCLTHASYGLCLITINTANMGMRGKLADEDILIENEP